MQKNVKLIDEAFKEYLKSVSLVITSLLMSLHDTAMDGLNTGFKVASDKFEKIIDSSEKIFRNTDQILEILLEGHHNIIVIVGVGTMSVLVILVLVQTSYMIKIPKAIKKKELEADKKIREMQKNWNRLEVAINSLTQEISQGGQRTHVTMIAPTRWLPALGDEHMGSFQRGRSTLASAQNILPSQNSETLSIE